MEVVTASPAETEALAARLAAQLRAGDVVAVSGELGAGKTTFVRGAARALGVTEPVSSPTFTIGHRYAGTRRPSRISTSTASTASTRTSGATSSPTSTGRSRSSSGPSTRAAGSPTRAGVVTLSHVDERHRRIEIAGDDDLRL